MNKHIPKTPGRRWVLSAGILAGIAGAGLSWWRWTPGATNTQDVEVFWSKRFEQISGNTLNLSAFRGQAVLVNFWATWCPPCVEELPMIDAFLRENSTKSIQVIALAIDQAKAVHQFLTRHPLSFPVALVGAEGMSLIRSLGNTQGGLPFSLFFKEDGSIYKKKLGQLTLEDLQDWLQSVR